MKTTSILLSLALAFKTIYSKAIDINTNFVSEQLNVPEEDNSFELVESKEYNFIYKLHCQNNCEKIKDDLNFAFNTTSNAFGKYRFYFYFYFYFYSFFLFSFFFFFLRKKYYYLFQIEFFKI